MHVLILNQTFHPDVAATAQHMWDLARHLDSAGHHVTALTSSYFYGSSRRHETPTQSIGNIDIIRVKQTGFGKKHFIGRVMDFASFYASAGIELFRRPLPDVILALTSPPMVSTLAMLVKQFRRHPDGRRVGLVYHVMDLYPDAAFESGLFGKHSIPARVTGLFTGRTLDLSDAVIALGRDMRDRLLNNYHGHTRAERIHVVTPWAEGDSLFPIPRNDNPMARELGLLDTFNLVYSGNLGLAHDLDTMLGAIEATKDQPKLRWIFIGGGKRFEVLKHRAEESRWPHVILRGFEDRENLNLSLNLADVHLVSQAPPFTGVVVPSKLFGILAVGKPSIMVGPAETECARIIAENQVGSVVAPGDVPGMLGAISQLQNDASLRESMGRRARDVFMSKYDRSVTCQAIQQILEQVEQSR